MIILPENRLLKWTVLLTSAASVLLAAVLTQWLAVGGSIAVLSILIVLCIINALGLLRLTVWARLSSTVLLWVVILSMVARFGPLSVDQYTSQGQTPPSVPDLIGTTLIVALPCLAAIVIMRRYRQEFRRAWL